MEDTNIIEDRPGAEVKQQHISPWKILLCPLTSESCPSASPTSPTRIVNFKLPIRDQSLSGPVSKLPWYDLQDG